MLSLVSSLTVRTRKNDAMGKDIKINKAITVQIFCQVVNDNKNTIKTGKINSALDKPNQQILNALPLDFVKYLETVVVAVWDIIPCPENLIKKIAINKKTIDEIFEKKKQESDKSNVT